MQVKTVERSASGPTVSRIPLLLIACDRHTDLHVVSLPGKYRRYRLHQYFPSQMGTGVPRTTGYHRRYRSLGTWTDHRVENVDVL